MCGQSPFRPALVSLPTHHPGHPVPQSTSSSPCRSSLSLSAERRRAPLARPKPSGRLRRRRQHLEDPLDSFYSIPSLAAVVHQDTRPWLTACATARLGDELDARQLQCATVDGLLMLIVLCIFVSAIPLLVMHRTSIPPLIRSSA
jgi:hypothetical protein